MMIKVSPEEFSPMMSSKTILVFGTSQSGKSTLINMLTGATKSNRSDIYLPEGGNKPRGCSFETTIIANVPFRGVLLNLIDTAGLNEADGGTVNQVKAIKNLIGLCKGLSQGNGVAGVIMVRSKGAILGAEVANVKSVYIALIGLDVPLFVFTTKFDGESIEQLKEYEEVARDEYAREFFAVDNLCMTIKNPETCAPEFREPYNASRIMAITRIDALFRERVVNNIPVQIKPDAWLTGWDVFCCLMNLPLNSRKYESVREMFRGIGLGDAETEEVMGSMMPEWVQAFKNFRIPKIVVESLREMMFHWNLRVGTVVESILQSIFDDSKK